MRALLIAILVWSSVSTASVAFAQPDLVLTAVTAPVPAGDVTVDRPFTVETVIENAGTVAVTATFRLGFELCEAASPTGCVFVGLSTVTDDFAPGQSRSYFSQGSLSSSTTAGAYFLRTRVDSLDMVAESDETNNEDYAAITVVAPTQPDLRVS